MSALKSKFARLTPRCKHHVLISMAVGSATLAHYLFTWFAPEFSGLSPLAGFAASLAWIWAD